MEARSKDNGCFVFVVDVDVVVVCIVCFCVFFCVFYFIFFLLLFFFWRGGGVFVKI